MLLWAGPSKSVLSESYTVISLDGILALKTILEMHVKSQYARKRILYRN